MFVETLENWPTEPDRRAEAVAMTRPVRVTVLGGGSWGTTVASLAAANTDTLLWARDRRRRGGDQQPSTATRATSRTARCPALRATSDLAEAAAFADVLVVGRALPRDPRACSREAAPHLRAVGAR